MTSSRVVEVSTTFSQGVKGLCSNFGHWKASMEAECDQPFGFGLKQPKLPYNGLGMVMAWAKFKPAWTHAYNSTHQGFMISNLCNDGTRWSQIWSKIFF